MTLPNFLVIGAAKAGTTSLHRYLGQHPQIFMSRLKETNFFALEGKPRFGGPHDRSIVNRDMIWRERDYRRLFRHVRGELAIGEASPRYLYTPGTARRIRSRIPEARLLAVLRQPAERAHSHFVMRCRDGFEPCATLEEALADGPRRRRLNWASGRYLEQGFYARQLSEYFDNLPSDQVRVFLFEDLCNDPQGLLRQIFEFLGVDEDFPIDTSRRENVSGTLANPILRLLWTRTHPPRRLIRPLLPKRLRGLVSRFVISRPLYRVPLEPGLRRRLTELYRDDILELQKMIDRDLSAWLAD